MTPEQLLASPPRHGPVMTGPRTVRSGQVWEPRTAGGDLVCVMSIGDDGRAHVWPAYIDGPDGEVMLLRSGRRRDVKPATLRRSYRLVRDVTT